MDLVRLFAITLVVSMLRAYTETHLLVHPLLWGLQNFAWAYIWV